MREERAHTGHGRHVAGGSPPRARGKGSVPHRLELTFRFTPRMRREGADIAIACKAGRGSSPQFGERCCEHERLKRATGSVPHALEKGSDPGRRSDQGRFTSAGAGRGGAGAGGEVRLRFTPATRGGVMADNTGVVLHRVTPACAGKEEQAAPPCQ
jgi:hypothetical protein